MGMDIWNVADGGKVSQSIGPLVMAETRGKAQDGAYADAKGRPNAADCAIFQCARERVANTVMSGH